MSLDASSIIDAITTTLHFFLFVNWLHITICHFGDIANGSLDLVDRVAAARPAREVKALALGRWTLSR